MKTNRASALLLTTILLFVVLSMVLSLTYITVMEQKMSGKSKSSVGSFYAAESGVEWALNKIATTSETTVSGAFPGFSASKADCPFGGCQVYLLDKDGKVITSGSADISEVKAVRSVGTQGETQRAIEAAVASGGASYTLYCFSDSANGTPVCPASVTIGSQGPCDTGFTVKKDLGAWGACTYQYSDGPPAMRSYYFLPPGGHCGARDYGGDGLMGEAYVCSQ
jgi:hypothetical protein